jgi:hypothetical protein
LILRIKTTILKYITSIQNKGAVMQKMIRVGSCSQCPKWTGCPLISKLSEPDKWTLQFGEKADFKNRGLLKGCPLENAPEKK